MLRLYNSQFSGSAWKIRILLNRLKLLLELRSLDLDAGETKTPPAGFPGTRCRA